MRKGNHVVLAPAELQSDLVGGGNTVERFSAKCARASISARPPLRSNLGISWALFLGAMMTGVVVTAPLSDNVFHAGAVGYGWLNAGGVQAHSSARSMHPSSSPAWARAARSHFPWAFWRSAMIVAPLSPWLACVVIYGIMGSGRGVSGVAMNTSIMEQVPQHFMGRVQNTFYFAGTALQIILGFLVGAVAQWNLVAGFSIIGMVYAVAFAAPSGRWQLRRCMKPARRSRSRIFDMKKISD